MSIRVTFFLLLAACVASCQKSPSTDLLQRVQFDDLPEMKQEEMRTWTSLPDAPSPVQPAIEAEKFHALVNEARSPFTFGAADIDAVAMRKTEREPITLRPLPNSTALDQSLPIEKEPGASAFWEKYLHSPSLKQGQPDYAPPSDSFMGRARYAASRIFITRDDSGKGRLNTSYLLGMLTLATIHTAYRPYGARSTSATFNDFGSTIGSDAGINVFHEFEPGIRQMVKGHALKFVSKIEERITHDHTLRDVVSNSTR